MKAEVTSMATIHIEGITLHTLTEEVLRKTILNKNFVILLSYKENPNAPTLFQRAVDYVTVPALESIGLVETVEPYNLEAYGETFDRLYKAWRI